MAEMLSCKVTSASLITAITALVNKLLRGECAREVIPIIFGGNLNALIKKSGGIRPIAVGYYWRRLAAKCANTFASTKLATFFTPIQLGVGVPGGCEAAIHTCRRYMDNMPDDHIIVKLDFSNAFNNVRRDSMLKTIKSLVPEIFNFCYLSYSENSILKFGDYELSSEEGCQQGDPLGPLLFCATIHPMLQSLSSNLIIGYLDDITLGGPENVVASDVDFIMNTGIGDGLYLNVDKCEQITKGEAAVTTPICDFIHYNTTKATLLGAPLSIGPGMDEILQKKLVELKKAASRLKLITSHDALVLLRASCGASKLLHIMRSSPCAGHDLLLDIDILLHQCLNDIANVNISIDEWKQACLPVSAGGLGIRSVTAIALPAFLASEHSTQHLQNKLLEHSTIDTYDKHLTQLTTIWLSSHPTSVPPAGPQATKQRYWDKPSVDSTYSELLASQPDEYNRARLLASAAAHSGDWLYALPLSTCGLRLDDETVRVAIGLRLGTNICEPHNCPCGSLVDCRGSHVLSCKKSSGRIVRHNYVNDLLYHALLKAGIPSSKEPAGLFRSDGKRPDGITQVPWLSGKCAIWDVTIVNTVAQSYLLSTSANAGSAAMSAETRKELKYASISQSHLFFPVALETFGPIGVKATSFLREIGRRMSIISEDPRETAFLFQRLSVAVQRFNAICFKDSFDSSNTDAE
jgi:hypothetical protein